MSIVAQREVELSGYPAGRIHGVPDLPQGLAGDVPPREPMELVVRSKLKDKGDRGLLEPVLWSRLNDDGSGGQRSSCVVKGIKSTVGNSLDFGGLENDRGPRA